LKYLLDTHVWLWWVAKPSKLSSETLESLSKRDNELFLSTASSWEIAIKYSLGRLTLPEHPVHYVPSRLARDGIKVLEISLAHSLAVTGLPEHHKDPFDRLLVAQASLDNLTLVTADAQIQRYPVDILKA